nr:LytTR family DNA-binding domain-containing protein [Terrimonas sp. H1YJ31]
MKLKKALESSVIAWYHQKTKSPFDRADRKMVKVMLQDISYIESMKDYVKIVTSNGVIITKQSISSLEAMLSEKISSVSIAHSSCHCKK